MKPNKTGTSALKAGSKKPEAVKRELPPGWRKQNRRFARRGKKILKLYCDLVKDEGDYLMGDLIADLMHACDQYPYWGSFADRIRSAYMHYEEETQGEEVTQGE